MSFNDDYPSIDLKFGSTNVSGILFRPTNKAYPKFDFFIWSRQHNVLFCIQVSITKTPIKHFRSSLEITKPEFKTCWSETLRNFARKPSSSFKVIDLQCTCSADHAEWLVGRSSDDELKFCFVYFGNEIIDGNQLESSDFRDWDEILMASLDSNKKLYEFLTAIC